jgi:polar amino acid transport system substrate-binding protein
MPHDTPAEYTPTGRLRAALNFGNPVLVGRDSDGRPTGITVDLATELARSLSVDLELVEFQRAFDVATAVERGAWDICFLAVDPARSQTIAFTAPYLQISGCYLVSAGKLAASSHEVVENGLRIGVVQGSAYTLFLSRQAGADKLVAFSSLDLALAAIDNGSIDGVAGIEQVMEQQSSLRRGSRVLKPPFMEIRQAIGVPKAREQLVPDLETRLSEFRRLGTLSRILERHGLSGDSAL